MAQESAALQWESVLHTQPELASELHPAVAGTWSTVTFQKLFLPTSVNLK